MSDEPPPPDDQTRPDTNNNAAPQSDDGTINAEVPESEPSDDLDEDASIEEEQASTADFEMWGAANRKAPQDQRFGTENAFNEAVNQVVNGISIINHYTASAPGAIKNNRAPVRA